MFHGLKSSQNKAPICHSNLAAMGTPGMTHAGHTAE